MPLPRLLPRLAAMPLLRPTPLTLRLPLTPTRLNSRLAKPTTFNPPSHPSRRPAPTNFPGPPTTPNPTKHYPHTPPPPNTLAHHLLTSRRLHFYLSISILFTLAAASMLMNFLHTNPFGRQVNLSIAAPLQSARDLMKAFKLSADEETRRVKEMRRRKVEDVEKRGEYRRAHGLEETGSEGGFGGWGLRRGEEEGRVRGERMVKEVEREEREERGWVERELEELEKGVKK